MNENNQGIYQEEKELDLKDLFFYLLRHWRSLIIIVVLGAMLGGGIYMTKKASFEKTAALSEEQQNWVETYQVSPELKEKMNLAWKNRQAYEKQLSYNQNSLVMKIDAENVYTGKLKYYIAAGSSTRLIAEKFNLLLNDSNLAEELNEAAGAESEPQYIRELVGCDTNADNDSAVNIATTEDGTAPSTKNVVVTYTVNYMEEEGCRNMLDVLREKADELNDALQREYGGFTCEQLGSSVVLGVNSGYLSQQKTNMDYLQSYANNFNSLESSFADQDLEYYQITYLNKEVTAAQAGAFSESKLKYLIIGIFLFGCLWGIVLVLRYVLDKHIKTVDEVKNQYNLPVLGSLRISKEKRGVDALIEKAYYSGSSGFDTINYIAQTISLMDKKRIMLCCEDLAADAEEAVAELKAAAPELMTARYVSRDTPALENATSMDGVVFLVQKAKTAYADIERSLEVCALQGINVIGAILFV